VNLAAGRFTSASDTAAGDKY